MRRCCAHEYSVQFTKSYVRTAHATLLHVGVACTAIIFTAPAFHPGHIINVG